MQKLKGMIAATMDHTVQISVRQLEDLGDALDRLQDFLEDSLFEGGASRSVDTARWVQIRAHLEQLIWEFQLRSLFSVQKRLEQQVVELAGHLNKPVQWLAEGIDDIDIPPQLLEPIYVSVLHGVRNSMTHGIESAAERAICKKPPVGKISLQAWVEADSLRLCLSDDGCGPNISRILHYGVQLGKISQEKSRSLAANAKVGVTEPVLELLFLPGFSTSPEVNELRGRGIGLDAVRSMMEKCGGKISARQKTKEGGFALDFTIPVQVVGLRVIPMRFEGQVVWVQPRVMDSLGELQKSKLPQRMSLLGSAEKRLFRRLDPVWKSSGPESIRRILSLTSGENLACRYKDRSSGQELSLLLDGDTLGRLL